jgi:hypothetical protein
MIHKDIKYVTKHYPWGFTVWISIDGTKKMLASKLQTRKEVNKLISNIKHIKVGD